MLHRARELSRDDATLPKILRLFARCSNEADMAGVLSGPCLWLTGAEAMILVSRDQTRPARAGRLPVFEGSATPLVRVANSRVAAVIESGDPCSFALDDGGLDEIDRPRNARAATLVPAAGQGSQTALAVFWGEATPPASVELDETLISLAAAAGMTLERIDAVRRERRGRAELQNRVRNFAALIRTVSSRSAESAIELPEYVMHFEGRLDALVRAQVALARSPSARVDFDDLLRDELLAQSIGDGPTVELSGMPVSLGAVEAEAMALATHELAVNALKFGPFASRGGALSVRWWAESAGDRLCLKLEWVEHCSLPLPVIPDHVGFGRNFVENGLAYDLKARTQWSLGERDFICRIALPLERAD